MLCLLLLNCIEFGWRYSVSSLVFHGIILSCVVVHCISFIKLRFLVFWCFVIVLCSAVLRSVVVYFAKMCSILLCAFFSNVFDLLCCYNWRCLCSFSCVMLCFIVFWGTASGLILSLDMIRVRYYVAMCCVLLCFVTFCFFCAALTWLEF